MARLSMRLAVLTLAGSIAACAGDSGEDSADLAESPGKPARQVEPESEHGTDRYSRSSSTEEAPAIDPEEALAAIPDSMEPATLLDGLKTKLLVPDVESGGVAMFTDVVTVEPGDDVTFCTYVAGTTEEITYIHDTLGSQSKHGHHAILQYSTEPQEAGTRRCEQESEEAQQGQILGGTGGEGTGAIELPDDIVSAVPAGSQFIINHHWINTGDTAIEAQAEMITVPSQADPASLRIARALVIAVPDFKIMPDQRGEHSGECTFEEDMDMLSMIGHQHSWGTHVKAERIGAEGTEVVFDHDYSPDMISHPLTTTYPADEPYRFNKGDSVRMTCSWENDSDEPLTFPREMCILFGWRLGGERDMACAKGRWR